MVGEEPGPLRQGCGELGVGVRGGLWPEAELGWWPQSHGGSLPDFRRGGIWKQ